MIVGEINIYHGCALSALSSRSGMSVLLDKCFPISPCKQNLRLSKLSLE